MRIDDLQGVLASSEKIFDGLEAGKKGGKKIAAGAKTRERRKNGGRPRVPLSLKGPNTGQARTLITINLFTSSLSQLKFSLGRCPLDSRDLTGQVEPRTYSAMIKMVAMPQMTHQVYTSKSISNEPYHNQVMRLQKYVSAPHPYTCLTCS